MYYRFFQWDAVAKNRFLLQFSTLSNFNFCSDIFMLLCFFPSHPSFTEISVLKLHWTTVLRNKNIDLANVKSSIRVYSNYGFNYQYHTYTIWRGHVFLCIYLQDSNVPFYLWLRFLLLFNIQSISVNLDRWHWHWTNFVFIKQSFGICATGISLKWRVYHFSIWRSF